MPTSGRPAARAEIARLRSGGKLVTLPSAAESVASRERLREDAERQAGHMRAVLSCRDADVARLSRELNSWLLGDLAVDAGDIT